MSRPHAIAAQKTYKLKWFVLNSDFFSQLCCSVYYHYIIIFGLKKFVNFWLQQWHQAISNGITVKAYPLKMHTAQAHE